jgi:hypothetical protein
MKKFMMRAVKVNFSRFIKTAAVVFMLTVATSASAQVTPVSSPIPDNESRALVTFVATGSESLLFDVKVDNPEGEKFSVVVKDERGTTLYRGYFYDKDFKKRFVVPKTDSNKLTFNIKSESGNKAESFEINTSTRIVEDVVVKKVI